MKHFDDSERVRCGFRRHRNALDIVNNPARRDRRIELDLVPAAKLGHQHPVFPLDLPGAAFVDHVHFHIPLERSGDLRIVDGMVTDLCARRVRQQRGNRRRQLVQRQIDRRRRITFSKSVI